ncbi:hypothetical protein BDV39DRAFT_3699 [Aspergillus sergii]|uniref:Uncharacterized protein n=1 Tax=Aspergillus sergii TaxID=1034303 RepID=A0A5N6XNX4_9EURO|nr:hypothetical protein BDV39DRAFT_3699 [Aspergillus sergii]
MVVTGSAVNKPRFQQPSRGARVGFTLRLSGQGPPPWIGFISLYMHCRASGIYAGVLNTENRIMAGPVRQPVDMVALENYIGQHDLGISPPLDLKQVTSLSLNYSLRSSTRARRN